jgi:ornithine cyclodeaminase/alanine dehydrogenase-like protein (mu-crystallin family)
VHFFSIVILLRPRTTGSLLATLVLGPSGPHHLLVFGAGNQIEEHIKLHISAIPTLCTCVIVVRSINARARGLVDRLRPDFPQVVFSVITAEGHILDQPYNPSILRECIGRANIICTATPSTEPLFPSIWVSKGTHLNLVGSFTPDMHEVDGDLIRRARKVVVDSKAACAAEAGELIKAGIGEDGMVELRKVATISQDGVLVRVRNAARLTMNGDVTIYKSVGSAAQDVVIADAVVRCAEAMGLGTRVATDDEYA